MAPHKARHMNIQNLVVGVLPSTSQVKMALPISYYSVHRSTAVHQAFSSGGEFQQCKLPPPRTVEMYGEALEAAHCVSTDDFPGFQSMCIHLRGRGTLTFKVLNHF